MDDELVESVCIHLWQQDIKHEDLLASENEEVEEKDELLAPQD